MDTTSLLATIVECPICQEVRRDQKYFQCKNGHNVCGDCKRKIDMCPQCRGLYDDPPRRNRTVEELILSGNFVFTCRHKGCNHKEVLQKLKVHEDSCQYRLDHCPKDCGLLFKPGVLKDHIARCHIPCSNSPDCNFDGTERELKAHKPECQGRQVPCPAGHCDRKVRAMDLFDHISVSHPETQHRSCPNGLMEEGWLLRSDSSVSTNWILVVNTFGGGQFVPRLQKSPENGLYYLWVHCVGSEKMAEKFSCIIGIHGPRMRIELVCPVFPLDMSRSEVWKSNRALELSFSQLMACSTKEGVTEANKTAGFAFILNVTYLVRASPVNSSY